MTVGAASRRVALAALPTAQPEAFFQIATDAGCPVAVEIYNRHQRASSRFKKRNFYRTLRMYERKKGGYMHLCRCALGMLKKYIYIYIFR